MKNPAIDTDDVLKRLASESARQGANLRTTVRALTLKALERRELTLEQIRSVLENVASSYAELCDARQRHPDRNVRGLAGERCGLDAKDESVQAAQERGQACDAPGSPRKAQDAPPGQDVCAEDR